MTSRRHYSLANWRKIIEDFRSAYQLRRAWEIVLIELVANSIDAGSSEIRIELEGTQPKILRITDNGKGMDQAEFKQYHNLGSLTKRKGSGIGWAGVGAKLYLDRCSRIYTETRSGSYEAASKWFPPRGQRGPIWDEVPPRRVLKHLHGTVVEILVSDLRECNRILPEEGKDTILKHFNYALRPYGSVTLWLNGERVNPFSPAESARISHESDVKLRDGNTVHATFFLLEAEAPPSFNLISLVVHGKTIGDNYDFRQGVRIREPGRIAGFVRCDTLIRVVTTSKDNFNRKAAVWRDFDSKVGKVFSDWLRKVGQLESPSTGRERQALANRVQRDLNRIFELPEIRNLQLDPFQSTARRRIPVPDPASAMAGKEIPGQQFVEGTLADEGKGQRVSVMGDEPGTSLLPDETGILRIAEHERLIKTGLKVRILPFPNQLEPAWMDFADQAIVVNESHPAFRCAGATGGEQFYLIETCFRLLCEQIEDDGERQATLSKLFTAYLAVNVGVSSGEDGEIVGRLECRNH